jgi:iron-sulfur cluster assembly accessory protein
MFSHDGANVVIDSSSLELVSGSILDYSEELIGSSFKILQNPHAASGCGCGVSFDLK